MRSILAFLLLLGGLGAVDVTGPVSLRGTVGVPLTAAIIASGGSNLSYGAINLPAGLSVDSGTGRITGTPTTATSTSVTLTANGGVAGTGSTTLILTVDAAAPPAVTNAAEWSVSAGSSCAIQLTTNADATGFTALGQPDALAVTPEGLLTGQAFTPGIYNIEVSADGGVTATNLVLEVLTAQTGAPSFTISVQPVAAIGSPFAAFIEAAGATGFTCTGLPSWLAFDTATGLVTGTPPSGTVSANLRLSASIGGAIASTVLAIPVATPTVADPVPASPAVIEGTESSGLGWKETAVIASTWGAVGLPTGLDIDPSSGVLTGTPVVAGNGNAVITATPVVSGLPISTTVALRIRAAATGAPQLLSLVPPVLTVGAPASIIIQTSGGVPTQFAASGSSAFSMSSTGVLSGTPTAAGLFSVTLSISNAKGTAVGTLLLQTGSRVVASPLPKGPMLFTGTNGSAFAASLAADQTVTAWTASGMPTGLALTPSTGQITGIAVAGDSNVFLSPGSNPTNAAVRILPARTGAPVITDAGPWVIGTGQQVRLAIDPGIGANWSITGLPTGLIANTSGVVTGSTMVAGDAILTLTASNSHGQTRTLGILTVEQTITGAPVFGDQGTLLGVVGTPFTGQLSASLSPIEYTVTGGPAWLVVVPATGALSGTPTASGTWLLNITARNGTGTGRSLVVLRVSDPAGSSSAPVSGISSGGCGAGGAAGLLLMLFVVGLRRRR